MFKAFVSLALLATALTACPGTNVPVDMRGEWHDGRISSIDYYNPVNGHWGQPSGAGDRFKLEANGDYERSRLLQITTYGCESFLFIWEKGTVRVENGQLKFQPVDGAVKSQSCSTANTFEKRGPGSVNAETYGVALEVNEFGQEVMTLSTTDGEGRALYGRPQ
jgi:hypothetical protein